MKRTASAISATRAYAGSSTFSERLGRVCAEPRTNKDANCKAKNNQEPIGLHMFLLDSPRREEWFSSNDLIAYRCVTHWVPSENCTIPMVIEKF